MPVPEPADEPLGTKSQSQVNQPYASGPGVIEYAHMSSKEKAIADRINAASDERSAVLSVYAISAQEDFERGMTKLAQLRLGLERLDRIGVIVAPRGDVTLASPGSENVRGEQ